MLKNSKLIPCTLFLFLPVGQLIKADDAFQGAVAPFLQKHCVTCHGPKKQEARVRLDRVNGSAVSERHLWTQVYEMLSLAQMPPDERDQPTTKEKRQVLSWIESQQRSLRSGSIRRLNRRELSAALQDLTGLPIDFAAGLPGDSKIDGFDTGADGLQDAADSVAQFLDVTRRAVESIRFIEPERGRKLSIDFREEEFNDFRKFIDKRWKSEGIFTKSKRLLCKKGVGVYLPTQWTGERGSSFLAVPAPSNKQKENDTEGALR